MLSRLYELCAELREKAQIFPAAANWAFEFETRIALALQESETQSRPEAELPEVTDEMVERGFDAYQRVWDEHEKRTDDKPLPIRKLVRAALQAAYGQQCAATRPAEVGGDAISAALTCLASVGHPVDAKGRYHKDGEWTFAEAVPRETDAKQVKAAFLILQSLVASSPGSEVKS